MTSNHATRATGWVLVGIQGVLLAVVAAWPAAWSGRLAHALTPGLTLVALGAVGVVVSAASLGRALTPHPDPNGAGLAAGGVYRWVRHPMYTAVLAASAGVASLRGLAASWLAVAALVALFEVKSRREERHLVATYPGYEEYAAGTGKYLPWLGKRRTA